MIMPTKEAKLLPANDHNITIASEILHGGGLVAFPTETLYGLGANARSDTAVRKVFSAKARPSDKALIVLVRNIDEATQYGVFNDQAHRLASMFWPGALTLILRRQEISGLSTEINPGGATIALRVPGNNIALRLLHTFSGPLTAPSANPSGAIPPTKAEAVLGCLGQEIDAVLDGGPCPGNQSTLIDISANYPRLLREGAISGTKISRILHPINLK